MGKCINIVPTIHSAFAILLHFYFVLLEYFIIYLYMNITAIYLLIKNNVHLYLGYIELVFFKHVVYNVFIIVSTF